MTRHTGQALRFMYVRKASASTRRKHSSRMRTARLPIARMASVATKYQHGSPQSTTLNRSSLGHQMSIQQVNSTSPGRGSLYGDIPCRAGGRRRTLKVRSNASWVMVTCGSSVNRQTHMTENVTSPQFRWRAVINHVMRVPLIRLHYPEL